MKVICFCHFLRIFVSGSFLFSVVILKGCITFIYYSKTKDTSTKCAFLFFTSSYTRGWTLVIADILLPELNGMHVVRRIRNLAGTALPVIGIFSTPWLPDREHFDAVLSKPFPVENLVDCVREYMRKRTA